MPSVMTFPCWYFLNCVWAVLLRAFLPTALLPLGDRTDFAKGEPMVLQSSPFVSVFDWVVVLSTLVGALSQEIATIWELLTCVPAYRLTLHRWPLQPCLVVWTLPLTKPSLLREHCSVSTVSLTLFPPWARLSPCIFGDVSQARTVSHGRGPRGMRNEQIFHPSSLVV